eukprot:366284-Chlamydomonas_euryale.AAC.6
MGLRRKSKVSNVGGGGEMRAAFQIKGVGRESHTLVAAHADRQGCGRDAGAPRLLGVAVHRSYGLPRWWEARSALLVDLAFVCTDCLMWMVRLNFLIWMV